MTQPIQEPSQARTNQGDAFSSRQLFRRPVPSGVGAGGALPYPPVWPNTAMTSHLTNHRFWPGGWIAVPAYAYNVDGTVITAGSDSAFAANGVRHDQSAANFAAAATTVEFTPADIGLPTGSDAPYYGVIVGMRINDTGTNIGVRLSPKPTDGNAGDSGYGQYVFGTGTVESYYGLFRLTYTTAGGAGTGYKRQFQDGDTITIKCYRTAGSGSVDLDNIYFLPVLNAQATPSIDFSEEVSMVRSLSIYSDLSATAQYSGFGGTPTEPYCDMGGGGGGIQDTQIRRGWRDPNLEWSGACGPVGTWVAGGMRDTAVDDQIAFHPRHVYAGARTRGTSFYGQSDLAGFIALGHDSREVAQCHVYSDHWGLYYLGLHPYLVTGQGEYNFALWMPNQDDAFPTGFPACSTGDNDLYEAVTAHDVWWSSSAYDWQDYRTGQYLYASESIL